MYGGLGFDPLYGPAGSSAQTFSFAGGSIKGNTLWTGPDTHFDIGITDGSRAWFAGTYTADTGTGASITGNSLTVMPTASGNCPKVSYAAEIILGYASGTAALPPPLYGIHRARRMTRRLHTASPTGSSTHYQRGDRSHRGQLHRHHRGPSRRRPRRQGADLPAARP